MIDGTKILKAQKGRGGADDFQTPKWAVKPLFDYIPKNWCVWDCAAGEGNILQAFWERGNHTIGSDILRSMSDDGIEYSYDFLSDIPFSEANVIVTNPPYSLKDEFIARCYEIGLPFALLMPLTTFDSQKRQKMFREHGLEVIFPPKRVNFTRPHWTDEQKAKYSSWFATAWFTFGLNIGRQLTFWDGEL